MSVSIGIIVSISGSALVRTKTEQGEELLTPLQASQHLQTGDVIVTQDQGATIQLENDSAASVNIPPNSQVIMPATPDTDLQQSIEEQIAALQQQLLQEDLDPDDLEATAAGENESLASDGNSAMGQPAPLLALDESPLLETAATIGSYAPAPAAQDDSARHSTNFDTTPNLFAPENNTTSLSFHSVTEDFQLVAQGQLATTVSSSQNISGTYGEISLDTNGRWQYLLDNSNPAVQSLGAGDTLTETINLPGQQLQLTIHGSNDQATVSGELTGGVKDIGDQHDLPAPEASGQLQVNDADLGEARFVVEFGKTTRFGEIHIDGSGAWTYRLNPELDAVRGLSEGQRVSDYVSVATLDGSRHTLRIDIEGSNHAPQIHSAFSPNSDPVMPNGFNIDLSTASSATGKLGILDPDFGESHFQAQNGITSQYGHASIDSAGNWHYTLDTSNSKVSALSDGEVLRDFVRVHSADNTSYDLIITVHGSDQPAYLQTSTALFDAQDDQLLLQQSEHTDSSELYIWQPDTPHSVEHISNFHPGSGGDTLVLSELLLDDAGNPEANLHFEFDGQHTTIELASGVDGSAQQLVLDHTDLSQFGSSDAEIIHNLIQQGNLDIASAS